MENQQIILHRYEHQQNAFLLHLDASLKSQHKKTIHQMRVAVKKMRAILSLIEEGSQNGFEKKGHFALFAGLYKQAGVVREAQVNLSMVGKYDYSCLKAYRKYLKKIQKKAQKALKYEMKHFDRDHLQKLDESLRQAIQPLSEEVLAAEAVAFIDRQLNKVHRLEEQLPDLRKLHKIRIRMKAVGEISYLIEQIDSAYVLPIEQEEIMRLNKLIGKWHDDEVLITSLRHFAQKKAKGKDKKRLKQLIKKQTIKRSKKEEKIQQQLGSLFAKGTRIK